MTQHSMCPTALGTFGTRWRTKATPSPATSRSDFPEKFRPNFRGAYFNDWTLRHDAGDLPVDRQRARDVIRYQWDDERLSLQRHDAITITDRAGIAGRREHARVELLDDPQARDLIGPSCHWCRPPADSPKAHSA